MLVEGTKRLEMIELAKTGITFCEVNDGADTTGEDGETNQVSEQSQGGTLQS